MDNQISTSNFKRLPKCMHIGGTSCPCNGNGQLPVGANPMLITKNPEFTREQLNDQTSVPIMIIDISKPLPRYKLNGFHKKITEKARREASQCIQGNKPILPQKNSLACIGIRGLLNPKDSSSAVLIKVCFELRSLYIKGLIVEGRFYELRKSNSATRLVEDSIALQCGETYYDMFRRENPTVELPDQTFVDAFWRFVALAPDAQQPTFNEAARCLGMLSLILIEPSRQNDVKDRLCTGDDTSKDYFTMDRSCWDGIRLWDDRSKIAKGIEYEKDQTIVEKVHDPNEVFNAVQQLNIVNSTKVLSIKKIAGPHRATS